MKKYIITLLAGIALLTQSCDDNDGYSIGDLAADWVTVHKHSPQLYTYTGDTWGTLWPAAGGFTNLILQEGQRAILYFNPLWDNFDGYDAAIKPEYIQPFLTKQVEELTEENEEEYANHPTYIEDAWISADYLHIQFTQKLPQEKKHRVSLVHKVDEPIMDDQGYIQLEYRYNSYGDTLQMAQPALVCYNLQTLPLTEAKGIQLRVNDARKGERVITFNKEGESTSVSSKGRNLSTMKGYDATETIK